MDLVFLGCALFGGRLKGLKPKGHQPVFGGPLFQDTPKCVSSVLGRLFFLALKGDQQENAKFLESSPPPKKTH